MTVFCVCHNRCLSDNGLKPGSAEGSITKCLCHQCHAGHYLKVLPVGLFNAGATRGERLQSSHWRRTLRGIKLSEDIVEINILTVEISKHAKNVNQNTQDGQV